MNNPADWDDSLILSVFRESIASHRRQNASQNSPQDIPCSPSEPVHCGLKRKRVEKTKDNTAPASTTWTLQRSADAASDYYSSNTRQQLFMTSMETNQARSAAEPATESGLHDQAAPTFPSIPSSTQPLLDDALQTMLMAWYQCGYATARYQTLAELGYSQWHGDSAAPQQAEGSEHAPAASSS